MVKASLCLPFEIQSVLCTKQRPPVSGWLWCQWLESGIKVESVSLEIPGTGKVCLKVERQTFYLELWGYTGSEAPRVQSRCWLRLHVKDSLSTSKRSPRLCCELLGIELCVRFSGLWVSSTVWFCCVSVWWGILKDQVTSSDATSRRKQDIMRATKTGVCLYSLAFSSFSFSQFLWHVISASNQLSSLFLHGRPCLWLPISCCLKDRPKLEETDPSQVFKFWQSAFHAFMLFKFSILPLAKFFKFSTAKSRTQEVAWSPSCMCRPRSGWS